MSKTVYKNASGLPDDEQVTTARDQAILGRAIQERFPRYYKYFSTRSFSFRGQSIGNHNQLLGRVEGVDGIKTGYIRASGFNLVTSVQRGNRHVVAVVLGGSSAGSRDARMRELIERHIDDASTKRTAPMIAGARPRPSRSCAKTSPRPSAKARPQVAAKSSRRPSEGGAQGRRQRPSQSRSQAPSGRRPAALAVASATVDRALRSPRRLDRAHRARLERSDPAGPGQDRVASRLERSDPAEPGGQSQGAPVPGDALVRRRVPPPHPRSDRHGGADRSRSPCAPRPSTPRRRRHAGRRARRDSARRRRPSTPMPARRRAEAARRRRAAAGQAAVRSGWIIQVGAFPAEEEAKQRLSRGAEQGVQGSSPGRSVHRTGGEGWHHLYRARFAGFDKDKAEAACKYLKRNDVDCVTIRELTSIRGQGSSREQRRDRSRSSE